LTETAARNCRRFFLCLPAQNDAMSSLRAKRGNPDRLFWIAALRSQ
jgi:hypothetical protein